MRWVEFLTSLLIAHGQTLQRLAALFGDDSLLEMLERVGEDFELNSLSTEIHADWLQVEVPHTPSGSNPYQELEWAVSELRLSPVLEFHLWAYPFYRKLVESNIDLNALIQTHRNEFTHVLVNESVKQAKNWVQRLPILPEQSLQIEKTALVPWLRFRSEVLKRLGYKPIASI